MQHFIIAPVLRAMGIPLPQQKFVNHLFSVWLCVRGRFNFSNMSRYSPLHERTFRRGFQKDFDWLAFNCRLLTMMIPCQHQLIAAMDASFIPKSGKRTPELGWFFNGCASRTEKGLEASTVALVDTTAHTAYGLSVRQTPAHRTSEEGTHKHKKSGARAKQAAVAARAGKVGDTGQNGGESRLDFYLRHLREVRPYFPALVRHLAVDGYYTSRTFVDGAFAMELDVIGKLRRDASLCHLYEGPQKRRGRRRVRGEKVNWKSLDLLPWHNEGEIEKGTRLFSASLFHNSLKRVIKVALLERKTRNGASHALLFSTDLALSGQQIVGFYRARFQIEFLFRDAKGSMGLNHCQSRQPKAIDFHWNASICALNLAKWQEERCAQKTSFSADSCKMKNNNELLLQAFSVGLGLDLNTVKSHPTYQSLCNLGVIAA